MGFGDKREKHLIPFFGLYGRFINKIKKVQDVLGSNSSSCRYSPVLAERMKEGEGGRGMSL